MKAIVLCFEVHQPYRIREDIVRRLASRAVVRKKDLNSIYFDDERNREVFRRVSEKCYLPTTGLILNLIDRERSESKKFKVAFSLSGTFIEQARLYDERVLDRFKELAGTGYVEFLAQTYYHSLSSLFSEERPEFFEQVKKHVDTIREEFKCDPAVFENTELIYNNSIARSVERLGFKAIFAEGVERVLRGRLPNFIYRSQGTTQLKVLLRNYKLTDDIAFRFSSSRWEEFPLTADKYAHWLKETTGDLINIFMDFETFGEHHWKETGIFEFLRWLPEMVLSQTGSIDRSSLRFMVPSEAADSFEAHDTIDVFELGGTTSWADEEKDLTAWLHNPMQYHLFDKVKALEDIVKSTKDPDLLENWRRLTTSDYFYYLCTKGGGAGEVHNYFSPYPGALHAYNVITAALLDFELRALRSYNDIRK